VCLLTTVRREANVNCQRSDAPGSARPGGGSVARAGALLHPGPAREVQFSLLWPFFCPPPPSSLFPRGRFSVSRKKEKNSDKCRDFAWLLSSSSRLTRFSSLASVLPLQFDRSFVLFSQRHPPKKRSTTAGLKSYPCGGIAFGSGTKTSLAPGTIQVVLQVRFLRLVSLISFFLHVPVLVSPQSRFAS
jgi:hypothetical protein